MGLRPGRLQFMTDYDVFITPTGVVPGCTSAPHVISDRDTPSSLSWFVYLVLARLNPERELFRVARIVPVQELYGDRPARAAGSQSLAEALIVYRPSDPGPTSSA